MIYKLWTIESCKMEALKYSSKKEFANKSGSAYNYARHNNVLDSICSHMTNKRKHSGYWAYENCRKDALNYETRNEYRLKSGSSYSSALKNNWLDEICSHMKLVGNRHKRCIYSYEFPDNHVYIGLTHNISEREINRNNNDLDSVTIHIKETGLKPIRKQLSEYVSVNIASKLEG